MSALSDNQRLKMTVIIIEDDVVCEPDVKSQTAKMNVPDSCQLGKTVIIIDEDVVRKTTGHAISTNHPELTTAKDQHPFPFFDLPAERRNRVYEYVFTVSPSNQGSREVKIRRSMGVEHHRLRSLRTCRQMKDEAEGFYYNLNHLCMKGGYVLRSFVETVSSGRLRAISVVSVHTGCWRDIENTLQRLAWLTRLRTLHVKVTPSRSSLIRLREGSYAGFETFAAAVPSLRKIMLATDTGTITQVIADVQTLLQKVLDDRRAEDGGEGKAYREGQDLAAGLRREQDERRAARLRSRKACKANVERDATPV